MKYYPATIYLIWASLAAGSVCGQDSHPDSTEVVVELEEIVVDASFNADGLSRQTILLAGSPGRLVSFFDNRPGVFVHEYGVGGRKTLRLRGADARQTAIVLDGVRLIDSQSGSVDLSLLPVSFLKSATLVRGAASGGGTLGGSVNLRTIRAVPGLGGFLQSHRGAFGDRVRFDAGVGSTGGAQAASASESELLVLDGVRNRIRRIDLTARVERDPWQFSDSDSYVGPSGIAYGAGNWYVGRMARGAGGPFADFTATGQILVVTEDGIPLESYDSGPAPTHIEVDAN